MLSRLKLDNSSWKPTPGETWKKTTDAEDLQTAEPQLLVSDYVFYASLLLLSATLYPLK